MKKLILSAVSLSLLLLIASSAGAQSISNPYYANPTWKLWATDTTPVTDGTLVTPGQVGIMSTTNLTNMFYPDDIVTPGKYLEYRKIDWGAGNTRDFGMMFILAWIKIPEIHSLTAGCPEAITET